MIARTQRIVLACGGVAIGACSVALVACSTILGFEDVTLGTGDGDGGVSGGDGSVAHDSGGGGDSALGNDGATGSDAPNESGCGDTQMSGDNCGRCGHSCFGTTCTAGVCQAKQVITGFNGLFGLAVDATTVYFTVREGNQVWKANKMDGASPLKLADQPDALVPGAIVVDDTYVYWANRLSPAGEIRRCVLAGCSTAGTSTLLASADLPTSVKIAGPYLYWAENTGGSVKRATRPDAGGVMTLLSADAGGAPVQVAIDDKYVYATDDNDGTVRRIPFDGGAVLAIAGSSGRTYGITTSDAGLFYLSASTAPDGVVWRVLNPQGSLQDGGATAIAFASSQDGPSSVITDDTNVYWTASSAPDVATGAVFYCPLTGCPQSGPIALATMQRSPRQITQDATQVYWANYGLTSSATDGSVMRVAKP